MLRITNATNKKTYTTGVLFVIRGIRMTFVDSDYI